MSKSQDSSRDGTLKYQLSQSQYHRVLADERRRALLAEIEGRTEQFSLDALTPMVVDRERGDGGTDEPDEVRISLHHTHLPLLDELGIVAYNTEDKTIDPRLVASDVPAD